MNRRLSTLSRLRASTPVVLVCAIIAAAGAFHCTGGMRHGTARAESDDQGHTAMSSAGVKAPIKEVLHCPLAFAGIHLLKERARESW
jgi:hypothetical protein